jgi:hypothetical protein
MNIFTLFVVIQDLHQTLRIVIRGQFILQKFAEFFILQKIKK